MADHTVKHDEKNGRFVIDIDGEEAGFAAYLDHGSIRDFNHTVVDPKFRGVGWSIPLIQESLDATRKENMTVVPSCSAVEYFISKRPEYNDLVVD